MRTNPWTLALVLLSATAAHADREHRRTPITDVVQKVSPAVVYIGTEQIVESRRSPMDDLFGDFFGPRERREAVHGLGSGVIIDPSGIVVTNNHVIRGASAIHVVLADGRQIESEVIGSDADNDLAVIKVHSNSPLPYAKLGTSSDLMIGETVVAIGSPFGLAKTVTSGVLSAVGRSFKADNKTYNDFLQTDAAINPGNSGGPLLNIDAEIIGINTAIYASGQGIGFAIPADKVRRIVNELTQFGKVRPSWVGVEAATLQPRVAENLGWDRTYGVVITAVDNASPAEKAGLQRGDIVAEVSGSQVADGDDFRSRMRGYPAQAAIPMTVWRNGQFLKVTVTPVEFPARLAEGLVWDRLGLRLRTVRGGMEITAVRPGTEAAGIGLEPGDVVTKFNNQGLGSMEAFREAVLASRGQRSVLLLVRRGRAGYYITLPM